MKTYLLENVFEATQKRLKFLEENFDKIVIAFSGGKDSTASLWLTVNYFKNTKKEVIVYFWDKESNHLCTKDYILQTFDELTKIKNVKCFWFCLPYKMRNALSLVEPWWTCWEESKKDKWIYQPPERDYVVTVKNNFLENYNPEKHNLYSLFADFVSEHSTKKIAVVVGLRADESLNRFRAVTKNGHFNCGWISKTPIPAAFNAYIIYDWDFADIWKYFYDNHINYNPIYDKMFHKGIFKREMRISQSFCDVSKKSMPYFREIEPESFERFLQRVQGVNSLTHLDLDVIKNKSKEISYDFLIQSFPDEIRKQIEKRAKIKDEKTVRALLNGDIRLKRVNRERKKDTKEQYQQL